MNKIKDIVLDFLAYSKLSTFLWTTVNWLLAIIILYITENNVAYAVVIIPIINSFTKYINNKHLWKQ
jgi:hypothetical protein